MHARFYIFARAFARQGAAPRPLKSWQSFRISQSVCRSCQKQFSTASLFRQINQAARKGFRRASTKAEPQDVKKADAMAYPARLQIYDAGTLRTWVVGFWKACAVFQFSITLIFVVPLIWKHQPDPTMRLFQVAGITLLGTIPTLLLSYLTAPYVARISIHLPASARVSKSTLQSFISRPPSTTTLEIATLRVFPFARTSFVQLKDLRSLPYQPSQLANFVRVEQEVMQKAKMGVWKKMWEVLKEPRWKFYVPDGKKYVPRGTEGVWEGLARYVRGVSEREAKEAVEKVGVKVGVKKKVGLSEGEMKERVARERVRRQTARKAGR